MAWLQTLAEDVLRMTYSDIVVYVVIPLFGLLSGNRARTVDGLHRKYGPVVRLGPNELSFTSPAAVDTIHNQMSIWAREACSACEI